MITRAAARRNHRNLSRALNISFAKLSLPWLAPAQLRWLATQSEQHKVSRRRRRSSLDKQRLQHARNLATTADAYPYPSDIPFDTQSILDHAYGTNPFNGEGKDKISELRPPSQPVAPYNGAEQPELQFTIMKGMTGSILDVLQHLHTNLRVGRLDRAQKIIKRLVTIFGPSSPEVLHAQTAYLQESYRAIVEGDDDIDRITKAVTEMQKWFEKEVRQAHVGLDAPILIVMIKAAVAALEDSQRDRAIRRYIHMAQEVSGDLHHEVQHSEEYDDFEYEIITAAEGGRSAPEEEWHDEALQIKPNAHSYKRPDMLEAAELPSVLPTASTGLGLGSVQLTLSVLADIPALPADASLEQQKKRAAERQLLLEQTAADVAIERWRKEDEQLRKVGVNTAMQSKPLGALMWQWYSALLPLVEKEIAYCRDSTLSELTLGEKAQYSAHIQLLSPKQITSTTVITLVSKVAALRHGSTGDRELSVKVPTAIMNLATALESEWVSKERSIKRRSARAARAQRRAERLGSAIDQETKVTTQVTPIPTDRLKWPTQAKTALASFLISKFIDVAQMPVTRTHPKTGESITQMQPAFSHATRYKLGRRVGFMDPNPALVAKLKSEPLTAALVKRMPMIVEPLPWRGWQDGAYYHYETPVMRLGLDDKTARDYLNAAHRQGDMQQVYAGLNALSKLAWKINHDVFKVQLEAWNTGEPVGNFAPLHPKINVPQEPEISSDPDERKRWLRDIRDIENKITSFHSQRCFQNFQMECARAMINETIYFPHNIDFRGRAYPIPPYLNHIGADNARGLLVFAEGKELGERGLRWLKIHLANVAGHDKASLQEREDFTMEHLDQIRDSAENPLGGKKWWLEAEDAWQTLAACFELVRALDSPDPTKFISHLPVHQDGTCNGLQHYAALGGDQAGAQQVNLEPGSRPADVYTGVAKGVEEQVEKDAAAGNPVAKMLVGNVTRKLVKQSVMTNVYGVTFYGVKAQVQRQLEILIPGLRRGDEVNYQLLSDYVALSIFKSMGSMFQGAQSIQTWLGQCADVITKSMSSEQIKVLLGLHDPDVSKPKVAVKKNLKKHGVDLEKPLFKTTVVWTTPLRLPVVQPYRKTTPKNYSSPLQMYSIAEPKVWEAVNAKKQLQAFPPNFIHSLDATHMMLSALKCEELGLAFASVHDSFWTHACDVDNMNVVLRDAFVAMHSDDVIGRLRQEFETRHKGGMYQVGVSPKSPAGHAIKRWRVENRSALSEPNAELAIEFKRLQLLQSDDPEQRKKGEDMVTPGSIFMSAEVDVAEVLPQLDSGLGEVPDEASASKDEQASDMEAEAEQANDDENEASPGRLFYDLKREEGVRPKKPQGWGITKIWLPVEFPQVPKKGDFDVKRLRESKYFFH